MASLDDEVYALAMSKGEGASIGDFKEALAQVPLETLVNAVNRLLQAGRLDLVQVGDRTLYRGVGLAEIELTGRMSQEDLLVYKQIENSGNEGIWVRTLKQKTNLAQTIVNRSLKQLETQGIIKSVKSVKHPTRKLYMLASVTPSADITGGPWFTDQEMDTDFIEQLARQCHQFIYAYSYPRHSPGTVYPVGHMGYPTAAQIKRFISDNRISTVELSTEHIEELLTMLVYDGKIERIAPALDMDMGLALGGRAGARTDWMYRALRITFKDSPFTDIPCGRCPVASRCSDTGSITPAKCEYFAKWLSF
ncbi:34-kDa subunit of RNA polymerase III (C) [Coemansia javaensis]|uniref:DNA-directed RNA polymerase III subunit RPC6 n=1 Tax=Coemansia javaensis TaxID=2761396 RepID=A0A9W8LN81_9FUNG|nr:34-kDa subunit of RNA polymerase III (C) [Coemansia javaensis]